MPGRSIVSLLPHAADPDSWPSSNGHDEVVSLSHPDSTSCYHGGAFFEAIGERFDALERRRRVIPADVLDAWFPPAPAVLRALRSHLEWSVRTSPPTHGAGLVAAIADARGVPAGSIVLGGGSSDLIFLGLTHWLDRRSRVLLLDPTYGEYGHVLERVVGCQVDRLPLRREHRYRVDVAELELVMRRAYDLVILVNPNSPTGQHVPSKALAEILDRAPARTRVWLDETYVEYAGAGESLERLAAARDRLVVCKSMSKMYALSVRVAYAVTAPADARALRQRTPPWAVSLPGQIAAVRALESLEYYRRRWSETQRIREELANGVDAIGELKVIEGVANFVLVHLAPHHPAAHSIVERCRARGLYLRDAGAMSPSLGDRALRIAVRDRATTHRILAILNQELHPHDPRSTAYLLKRISRQSPSRTT